MFYSFSMQNFFRKWMFRIVIVVFSFATAACMNEVRSDADMPNEDTPNDMQFVTVNIMAGSQYCGTQQPAPLLSYYADETTSQALLSSTFPNLDTYSKNMVLIEAGQKNTGGYGLMVEERARIVGDALLLTATWQSPAANQFVTQAFTSPCVLVAVPKAESDNDDMSYSEIQVYDQNGELRATNNVNSLPAPRYKTEAPSSIPAPAQPATMFPNDDG